MSLVKLPEYVEYWVHQKIRIPITYEGGSPKFGTAQLVGCYSTPVKGVEKYRKKVVEKKKEKKKGFELEIGEDVWK